MEKYDYDYKATSSGPSKPVLQLLHSRYTDSSKMRQLSVANYGGARHEKPCNNLPLSRHEGPNDTLTQAQPYVTSCMCRAYWARPSIGASAIDETHKGSVKVAEKCGSRKDLVRYKCLEVSKLAIPEKGISFSPEASLFQPSTARTKLHY